MTSLKKWLAAKLADYDADVKDAIRRRELRLADLLDAERRALESVDRFLRAETEARRRRYSFRVTDADGRALGYYRSGGGAWSAARNFSATRSYVYVQDRDYRGAARGSLAWRIAYCYSDNGGVS